MRMMRHLPDSPINDDDYSSVYSDVDTEETRLINEETDIVKYVNDFMNNEKKYYKLIKSYCYGRKVEIFIEENDIVISAAYLEENSTVSEYIRNTVKVDKSFESIWKWVNDVKGRVVTGKELVESVFIGWYNYVTLVRIMMDAVEEESINEDDAFEESISEKATFEEESINEDDVKEEISVDNIYYDNDFEIFVYYLLLTWFMFSIIITTIFVLIIMFS